MNACAMWDFRWSAEGRTVEQIIDQLRSLCKKWVFQLEKGEKTGYLHYQCRISLIKKHRKSELLKMFQIVSAPEYMEPTANATYYTGDIFYVTKDETRVEGPWRDDDIEKYIPIQYRDLILYPWQQDIVDSMKRPFTREINMIVDKRGNSGKSSIASLCEILYDAIDLPPLMDFDKIIEMMFGKTYQHTRNPPGVFLDIPRALPKKELAQMFAAIEQIKKGKLWDTRYAYKTWWIDSPAIWVFSNDYPDLNLLSRDRWVFWDINPFTNSLRKIEHFELMRKIEEKKNLTK